MTSLFKYLITITTTLILVIGVPLSSFAYSLEYYHPDALAGLIYQEMVGNNIFQTSSVYINRVSKSDLPQGAGNWIFCDGLYSDPRLFDYYYSASVKVYNNNAMTQDGTLTFSYEIDDLQEFNSIAFNVGVFGSSVDLDDSYKIVAKIKGEIVDLPFTLSYVSSDRYYSTSYAGLTQTWRMVQVFLYFDKVYNFDTASIFFECPTYLPAANNQTLNYYFGASDMIAKVVTQEEYVAQISQAVVDLGTKLDTTNEQLTIIGDTASQIKDQVTEITDTLTKELTPEQQQQVQDVLDSIEHRAEVEDAVIDDFNNVFESFDNIDYDPFGDSFKTQYDDVINPLWNSPFLTFWNTFWLEPAVVTLILLVLGFSIAGFVLYGVR